MKFHDFNHATKGTCENITTGEEIGFNARIKIKSVDFCTEKKSTEEKIKLQNGLPDDVLTLDIKCQQCECQKAKEPNSTHCMGNGTLICGGCHCK